MLRNVFVKTLFKQREVKMRRCVKSLGVDYYWDLKKLMQIASYFTFPSNFRDSFWITAYYYWEADGTKVDSEAI